MDDKEVTLPFRSAPRDHMRNGFLSLEAEMSEKHPVSKTQSHEFNWKSKMEMVRQMHGIHMAMRLSTEREIFRRPRRLPGLQASKLSLDTALGIDDAISFSDFLNDPLMRPVTAKNGVHELMETNLGI